MVEQTADSQKFNRGALLNAGYDFLTQHAPAIQSFVMHDVDVVFPEDFVRRYYGTDSKSVVHLGSSVKGKTYAAFLGRVIRFSKQAFKETNGFPNNFYGWGGEDDALVNRLGDTVVYRPTEVDVGEEMKTVNDIKEGHLSGNKELFKVENLVMDAHQWKINGVNSVQYQVLSHEQLGSPNFRKITVSLVPRVETIEMVYDATGGADLMDAATHIYTGAGGGDAEPVKPDAETPTESNEGETEEFSEITIEPNEQEGDAFKKTEATSIEPEVVIKVNEQQAFNPKLENIGNTESLEETKSPEVKVIKFG